SHSRGKGRRLATVVRPQGCRCAPDTAPGPNSRLWRATMKTFRDRLPHEYTFRASDAQTDNHRARWQFPRQLVESDAFKRLSHEAAAALPALAFTSFYGEGHSKQAEWGAEKPFRFRK